MAVHAALRQLHVASQDLLEDFLFQIADSPVLVREFLIGTTVFAEYRELAIVTDFDVVTVTDKGVAEPLHPLVHRSALNLAESLHHCVAQPVNNLFLRDGIDSLDFPPENQRQVAIVVAELPQALGSDLIDVMRPSTSSPHQTPHDHLGPFEPSEALSNGRRRYSNRRTEILNRSRPKPMKVTQEVQIRVIERFMHRHTKPDFSFYRI